MMFTQCMDLVNCCLLIIMNSLINLTIRYVSAVCFLVRKTLHWNCKKFVNHLFVYVGVCLLCTL